MDEFVITKHIASHGKDPQSENYVLTRTAVLYYVDHGKTYAAFDDNPNPLENIILARAQEGYKSHLKKGTWLLPKTDTIIDQALKRAQTSGRFIEITSKDQNHFSYATGKNGTFGQQDINQAIFGLDTAQEYSNWLADIKNELHGYDWLLHQRDLKSIGLDETNVEVRVVAFGGVGYNVVGLVVADGRLDGGGRAAGVASKKFLQTK